MFVSYITYSYCIHIIYILYKALVAYRWHFPPQTTQRQGVLYDEKGLKLFCNSFAFHSSDINTRWLSLPGFIILTLLHIYTRGAHRVCVHWR